MIFIIWVIFQKNIFFIRFQKCLLIYLHFSEMSQAGTRRDRSKSYGDESGVPSPENSAQSPKSASSPLSKIVFIQKVALFAGSTPKKALQLAYVSSEWRETVVDFTFDALFFEPFVKPLLQQIPSTSATENEKDTQQQNEQKKLELFQQFRKVVSFVFQRVSDENEAFVVRMKTFLAVVFDFVHNRRNSNKNNYNINSNDDDSNYVTNAGYRQEVVSFLRADSLCSFLPTEDLHDLIINHIAPRVTAIDEFGELVCSIFQDRNSAVRSSKDKKKIFYREEFSCFLDFAIDELEEEEEELEEEEEEEEKEEEHRQQQQQSAELFSNVESFSAILKCFHRSKKSSDARLIASSINNILSHDPLSNILLNSLPVVEAFSFIIPLARGSGAVAQISDALLGIFNNNEEGQNKFATPQFWKIFKGMEKHATTAEASDLYYPVWHGLQPIVRQKALADATTSSQLKSAVDILHKDDQYFTRKVRDLLIAKKDLIVDAATADSVVKFLFCFSQDESRHSLATSGQKSLRPLLRTKEVQELIIKHIALHLTAIEDFGGLICDITQNKPASELFCNVESFSAILKCFHSSKTSNDAAEIASSIYNILSYNPSSNELLNSLPVVEAFSFIIPLAKNSDAVEWISRALIAVFNKNEEAQQKFATTEFLEIFKGMEKHATTEDSKTSFRNVLGFINPFEYSKPLADSTTSSQLKSAVDSLPRSEKYYTEKVRDLLIAKKDLIVDAQTADSVVNFLHSLSKSGYVKTLLQSKEAQDLVINHIAPHVAAINDFGGLIYNIVQDRQSAELFSNVESFSAILKCFHRSKTSEDARWIASSINNILTNNPSSNKLLNSLPVLEAFSFIIPLANDDDAGKWISKALEKILDNNEEAQMEFATPEFLKVFQGLEKLATTEDSKVSFRSVLGFVDPTDYSKPLADAATSSQLKSAVDSPHHKKYYSEKVRDLIIAKKNLIVDAETADSVLKFFRSFTRVESLRPLLRTKQVQDLIINNIAPHVTAIYDFGSLICNIVQDQQSAVLFSNVESFSTILNCFHRSKTSRDALWIASSINNILANNPSSNKLLKSLPVVEAFSFIIPRANDDDAVQWISNALRWILNNNEEAIQKFAKPEFLKIFQGMEKHLTTDESYKQFETVLVLLMEM